jgi:hypothetical protein
MSDKDVEFIRNTATSLNTNMSEEAFRNELNNLKQRYIEKVRNK